MAWSHIAWGASRRCHCHSIILLIKPLKPAIETASIQTARTLPSCAWGACLSSNKWSAGSPGLAVLRAGEGTCLGTSMASPYGSSAAGANWDVCNKLKILSNKEQAQTREWVDCIDDAMKVAAQFNPSQVASILESCAFSNVVDFGLLEALACQVIKLRGKIGVEDMNKILKYLGHLVACGHETGLAAAENNIRASFPSCQLLADFLIVEAESNDLFWRSECEGSALSSSLYGLGQLCRVGAYTVTAEGRQFAGILIGELCKQDRLSSLDEKQLSEVFYTCAVMKYKHFSAFRLICALMDTKLSLLLSLRQAGSLPENSVQQMSRRTGEAVPTSGLGHVIATMLWSLGSLHFKAETTTKILLDLLEWEAKMMNGKQIAMCLKGMSRLDYWPSRIVNLLASRLVEKPILMSLEGTDLEEVLAIFAQYRFQNVVILDALWSEMSHEMRLPSLTKESLLNVMDSLWKLGYRKVSVWKLLGNHVVTWGERAKLEPADLGFMVLAFGKAGYRHDSFLGFLSKYFLDSQYLSHFASRDLVNICYGFSLVGYRDTKTLKSVTKEIVHVHRLDNYTEDQLTSFVYSFGRLKYRNKDLFDALAWEVSNDARLRAFSEQNLSNILWGYGKVQYFNKGTVEMTIMEATSQQRLPAYTNQGLVNIIYCIGRLNYRNPQILVSLGKEASSSKRLESFTSQAISNIAFAFGKLDFRLVSLLIGLNQELSKKGRLKAFNELELANLMYGLGELRFSYSKATRALELEVTRQDRLRQFTGPDLCNVAFGFSGMYRYVASALEAFIDEVLKPERIRAFTNSELQAITIRLEDIPAVNGNVLDILAKELTSRHDASLDWEYPIFRPWKGQWFFQPPYQLEPEATEEEIDTLLRKFIKIQQQHEQEEGQGRPRWNTIDMQASNI